MLCIFVFRYYGRELFSRQACHSRRSEVTTSSDLIAEGYVLDISLSVCMQAKVRPWHSFALYPKERLLQIKMRAAVVKICETFT